MCAQLVSCLVFCHANIHVATCKSSLLQVNVKGKTRLNCDAITSINNESFECNLCFFYFSFCFFTVNKNTTTLFHTFVSSRRLNSSFIQTSVAEYELHAVTTAIILPYRKLVNCYTHATHVISRCMHCLIKAILHPQTYSR